MEAIRPKDEMILGIKVSTYKLGRENNSTHDVTIYLTWFR